MERNLFKYIWKHSRKEQVGILLLVAISLPFYFFSLNLPKSIVNEGIQGEGFDSLDSTQPVFRIDLPFGEMLTGETVTLIPGFQVDQMAMLLALSFAFLALVLVNGLFKFVINTRKGRMGERMLRRLRYELADRILRFPVIHLRRVKQAEMATMVKDEVEPLGGFIGDAFVTPAFLGGQAITALGFIMVQSLWLGSIAAGIVGVQAFLIPKLRRRILVLGRERQLTARQLAGRIAEIIDGAVEVQANDTSNLERADLVGRLGRIFLIRYEIFQRKFFVKFLNNFLSQFTPFVFYAGGGLLAIYGHLDIGALVAVIAAYKDLPGPVKELIDWDQQRLDVQIKYDQVIEQFQPATIIDPDKQAIEHDPGPPLTGDWQASNVSLVDDNDIKLLDSVSFISPVNSHIAIVGPAGSGKSEMGLLLAGLVPPTSGAIRLGGKDMAEMPTAITGQRISYVGPDTYHFAFSVRENLLYGLKHRPLRPPQLEGADLDEHKRFASESRRSGNPPLDLESDWIDYEAAGAAGPEDIDARMIEILRQVELEEDVYRFGLAGTIDPATQPEIAEAILNARAALTERLDREGARDLVDHFAADRYNGNATLAENLLFGTPRKREYETTALAKNALMLSELDAGGLTDKFLDMGISIAKTMVEIFADLPPGHPFFEQFSFISDDDLPEFRSIVSRSETAGLQALGVDERQRLMGLPFLYVEARHRLGLIDEAMEGQLLGLREAFAARLREVDPDAVEPYNAEAYNAAASLQDNILFGRVAFGRAHAEETVGQAVTELLDDLGLRQTVITVGLGHQVGVGGKRLSSVQRQKLGLARAVLKQPDVLVVSEALGVMDGKTQERLLDNILKTRTDRGVIWTLQRAALADHFDRIVVMRSGRVVEQGAYDELLGKSGSFLHGMLAAE